MPCYSQSHLPNVCLIGPQPRPRPSSGPRITNSLEACSCLRLRTPFWRLITHAAPRHSPLQHCIPRSCHRALPLPVKSFYCRKCSHMFTFMATVHDLQNARLLFKSRISFHMKLKFNSQPLTYSSSHFITLFRKFMHG